MTIKELKEILNEFDENVDFLVLPTTLVVPTEKYTFGKMSSINEEGNTLIHPVLVL